MVEITDKVSFDETKPIQQQSTEFQQWFTDNCPINDKTPISAYDEYNRPGKYVFTVDNLKVNVEPNYINPDRSNWAISGYNISIN
jgi:hypothetical protein